jgi:hypothetical protein
MIIINFYKKIFIIILFIAINVTLLLEYSNSKEEIKELNNKIKYDTDIKNNLKDKLKDYEYISKPYEKSNDLVLLVCKNDSYVQNIAIETFDIHEFVKYNVANRILLVCSDETKKEHVFLKKKEFVYKIYTDYISNFTFNYKINKNLTIQNYQKHEFICNDNKTLIGFFVSKTEHKIKQICVNMDEKIKSKQKYHVSSIYLTENGLYGNKESIMCNESEFIYHINFITFTLSQKNYISNLEIFCDENINKKFTYNKISIRIGALFDNIAFINNNKNLQCPSCSNGGSENIFTCRNNTSLVGFDRWIDTNKNILTGIRFYCM